MQQPEIDFAQAMRVDAKYQDIIYYKWDRHESVHSSQNKKISYHQAVSEMEKLDWEFVHNHFGLVNKHTNETIQFVRLGKDRWYVENLIEPGTKWNGYLWYSQADSKSLYEMVRLFLEEIPWSHILQWKLKRVKS